MQKATPPTPPRVVPPRVLAPRPPGPQPPPFPPPQALRARPKVASSVRVKTEPADEPGAKRPRTEAPAAAPRAALVAPPAPRPPWWGTQHDAALVALDRELRISLEAWWQARLAFRAVANSVVAAASPSSLEEARAALDQILGSVDHALNRWVDEAVGRNNTIGPP